MPIETNRDGTVAEILVTEGQAVAEGDVLVRITEA
jgi:biotin carboxyl carrier protein